MTPFKKAGEIVTHERKRQGISLRRLAELARLSPTALCGIEQGKFRPTPSNAMLIVLALNSSRVVRRRLANIWSQPDVVAVQEWKVL